MNREQNSNSPIEKYLTEVEFSLQTVDRIYKNSLEEITKTLLPSRIPLRNTLSLYINTLIPTMPEEKIVHGAILLEDNQLSSVSSQPSSLRILGGPFSSTESIHYPKRIFFLPETLELVSYQSHEHSSLPHKNQPFQGWETYRASQPDNFHLLFDPESTSPQTFEPQSLKKDDDSQAYLLDKLATIIPKNFEQTILKQNFLGNYQLYRNKISTAKNRKGKILKNRIEQSMDAIHRLPRTNLLKPINLGPENSESGYDYLFLPNSSRLVIAKPSSLFSKQKIQRGATLEEWFDLSSVISHHLSLNLPNST